MLSDNLKRLRAASGKSQVEMAKKLGVTKQSVSNWENDNILPSLEMAVKIAAYFNVTVDALLNEEEKRYLEVTGLTDEQIYHLQQIINYIRK